MLKKILSLFRKTKVSFGALPDPVDTRDYLICSGMPKDLPTLPSAVDLSNDILIVKNQGQEGTCVANASSALKESMDKIQLSVRYIYYYGRQISGMPPIATPNVNEGMVPRDAMKCIADRGVCEESLWSYKVFDKSTPPPNIDDNASKYKFKVYTRINNVNELKYHLAINKIPAMLTVPIFDNGVNWYTQNVKNNNYTVKIGGNQRTSGHAILVVGYDESRGAFKILNSWGTGWGQNGYAWLPYNYQWSDCWTGVDTDGHYDYQYIGQSDNITLKPGETKVVKLTLKNTGNADWLPNKFNIGTKNPQDRPSLFYNSDWLDINRIDTVKDKVQPGASYEFQLSLTAPKRSKVGSKYKEYFCPVVEGVTWLKDIGIYTEITIGE